MTTVKTVIFSNLEDIKVENGMPSDANNVTARANFIKWLLINKPLTQEIDADAEFARFSNRFPHLVK